MSTRTRSGVWRIAARALAACVLAGFLVAEALSQATVLEVIPLRYRTAQEIIPVIQPLLSREGSISGMQSQLIVRTTPANLEEIKRVGPFFERAGARVYVQLPVSAAFHSRYMVDAANAFADFLAPLSFDSPKIQVVANVTAEPYPTANASESVKSLLTRQLTHSVEWARSVRFLIRQGCTQLSETGPGNVLTKMLQQIQASES